MNNSECLGGESTWLMESVDRHYTDISKCNVLGGSSCIELFEEFKKLENSFDQCINQKYWQRIC